MSCAAGQDDELGFEDEFTSVEEGLTGAARRPRSEKIRDVSAQTGLTNGVLMAGIAQVETGLSHCWSEATWACQGPFSSSCGGPVIAGASDGPCSARQGGLGMFQFDGGTYDQTLARDGHGILTLEGNISHAVDFVVGIVRDEVAGIDSRAEALAWLNSIPIARGNPRFEQWNDILACRYNGRCGSASQAAKYRDATLGMWNEFGAAFWTVRSSQPDRHDVNGDGRADLVSVRDDGSAYVWSGQASGRFGSAVASFRGTLDTANVDGTGHYVVGVADVTGDGKSDLVSVHDGGSAYVWPGQASGLFGGAIASFDGTLDAANVDGTGHYIVGVADVTGDGRADLVSARDDGSAYVWPGRASGLFGGAVASFRGTLDTANVDGTGHYVVGVADVTGDGHADLVSVHSDGSAYVWPARANGLFGGAVASFRGTLDTANIDGTGHYIVGVADVTGDGRADLVSARDDGSAYVWPGQASGLFGGAVASFRGTLDVANVDGTGHYVVGVADVTGDGRADLMSAHGGGSAYVWPGQTNGLFGGAVASFNGTLDVANVDGAGHYLISPAGLEL